MKLVRLCFMAALVPLTLLIGCGAQSGGKTDKAQAPAEKQGGMASMPAAGEGATTAEMITCPVSSHQVARDKAYTIEYEGKTIAFCCADCEEPFRAEPARYMAAVEQGTSTDHDHSGH